MTDPTPATPAADPSAPAAAASTTSGTPPTPTPAAAAAPAVEPKASLIPDDPAAPAATPAAADPAATPAKDEGPEWFLADGVKGTGPMPEWYRADKYKTLTAQAEAYAHLEKRFGAFVGAPKDGKYEVPKAPEGTSGEFDAEHPLIQTFTNWAAENQVSQKAYGDLLGMFAQYEASQTPNMAEVKAEIGKDADERIGRVSVWARANLTGDEFEAFRAAMSDRNAATVFKAVEAVVARNRQPPVAKPGAGGEVVPGGLQAIDELQAKLGPDGKRLYETDQKWRAMVERKRVEYFESQERAA